MELEMYIKKLFFNAPIEKDDKSLLRYFEKEKHLNEIIYEGVTIYPPLSALKQETNHQKHTFQFKKNPAVNFTFREGELELEIRKSKKIETYHPVLKFFFDKKSQVEKSFQTLTKEFDNGSNKKTTYDFGVIKSVEFVVNNSKTISIVTNIPPKENALLKGGTLLLFFN